MNNIFELVSYIEPGVILEGEVTIYPPVTILGKSRIENGVTIYPNSLIIDSIISEDCKIFGGRIENSFLGRGVKVAQGAYVSENSIIENNAELGAFVEINNSFVGYGSKVVNYSFVQDCHIENNCLISRCQFSIRDNKCNSKFFIGRNTFVSDSAFFSKKAIMDCSFIVNNREYQAEKKSVKNNRVRMKKTNEVGRIMR